MKKSIIAIVITLVAVGVFAQHRNRPVNPAATLGAEATFAGTVTQFSAAPGAGAPRLVILTDDAHNMTFELGPYWYLQQQKLAAAPNDRVEVVARSCSSCPSGYVAVTVRNLATGVTVALRAADGTPLWAGQSSGNGQGNGSVNPPPTCPNGNGSGNGNGNGNGYSGGNKGAGMGGGRGQHSGMCNGAGPDMTKAATFEGTVVSFAGGAGAGRPTLVLSTAAGNRTLLVAPYRAVMAAGVTFTSGDKLSVKSAPVVNDGVEEWVVVSFRNVATGFELALRDATTGYPLQGGRGRQ
ncbi:MAG: hypothetical protein WC538_21555 [Thermoanaerobaculia bacterium]